MLLEDTWFVMLQVDILLLGYPCKSISAQNNSSQAFNDKSSVTGGGFAALMRTVDKQQPEIVIAENVARLTHKRKKDGGKAPADIQQKAFERRGYSGTFCKVNSAEFGLAQCRTRCWAFYIKTHGNEFLGLKVNLEFCILHFLSS